MANRESLRFSPVRLRVMRLALKDVSPESLAQSLPQWSKFFEGEKVLLDLTDAAPLPLIMDWARLKDLFENAGIEIVGICGAREAEIAQIKRAHLLVFDVEKENLAYEKQMACADSKQVADSITEPAIEMKMVAPSLPENLHAAHLVEAPVRSGVEIFHPDDVVVLGRVNAGAQILAGGNIFVCGALKGKALAGGADNKSARIFTASMQAELVSIAGVFQKFENGIDEKFFGKSVCIYLESEGNLERLKMELL